ncbi:ABC transporter ATP-binding protein [bacterium]|nr:ABC transporter ATP-binding protein [bacterium]
MKESFLALIRGAWHAISSERPRFFIFVVLFIFAYSLDLLAPWAIGYTLGVFVKGGFNQETYLAGAYGILAYTGIKLAHVLLHHTARYVQNTVTYNARMNTLSRIFGLLMRYPLRWHIETHSGENLSKLHRSAGAIDSVVGTYVWQVIEGGVKVFFASVAIFALDAWVALLVLALSIVTILAMIFFNQKLTNQYRENNAFGNKLNRICVDYLVNIVTVKTLGLEKSAERHLQTQKNEGLGISQRISLFQELKWGSTGIGYAFVIGASLAIYFYRHQSVTQAFDVAEVYVLLNYLDRIFQAIGSFTAYYGGLLEASTAYEDASKIEKSLSDYQDMKLTDVNKIHPLNPAWTRISIKNLNFSYTHAERRGLKDVELAINRKDKIALVGPSGGGKSTLLKVMAGLLYPSSYSIATDAQGSVAIEDLSESSLLIPQEPEIFSETVLYNMTMGEDFDSKELQFFAQLCRFDSVINKLPLRWDNNLAEKGLNISVGEKQRGALARGLLRASRKDILLLDEPTSSLDPKTEKEIFIGLLYHFADRTILTACHRLNLVALFDKIIFLDGGSVIEIGSFDELLKRQGAFYKAWEDYQNKSRTEPTIQPLPA